MPLGGFLEASWGPFRGLLGASWGLLGASSGEDVEMAVRVPRLGPLLEPSWGPLGPPWMPLGPFWGALGDLLGRLGAVFGGSWAVLERRKLENARRPKTS